MIDKKKEQIKQMLYIIMESSHSMPDYVFHYYVDFNKNPEEKIFFNLIADSFLTLFSYSKLIFEHARSQAFAILRIGLEQVAAVCLLATKPDALDKYINLHKLKVCYIDMENTNEREEFKNKYKIKNNRINDFFDYGWISGYTNDGKYGRNQLLELAGLGDFVEDIEQTLNAFSHGSLSIFQMSGNKRNVLERYVTRSNLICCYLYDVLCCSYHQLIGHEEFVKLPLNKDFIYFKSINMALKEDNEELK